MYNHAPEDYVCPICLAVEGVESDQTMIKQADIFYRDDLVAAMINSKFAEKNPGHVIVVPLKHYENIYDLPLEVGQRVFEVAKRVALALKEVRKCDGVMTLQNNEPASEQHAFHYHFHLYPRFNGDNLHQNIMNTRVSALEERVPYAEALRDYFLRRDKISV